MEENFVPHTPQIPESGLVLAVLQAGPANGYDIALRLYEWSKSTFRIGESMLYSILHRLEAQSWVISRLKRRGDRVERVYRLTMAGEEALETERVRWRQYVAGVDRVLEHGERRQQA